MCCHKGGVGIRDNDRSGFGIMRFSGPIPGHSVVQLDRHYCNQLYICVRLAEFHSGSRMRKFNWENRGSRRCECIPKCTRNKKKSTLILYIIRKR